MCLKLEELRKQVEEQKEQLKKKDEEFSQYQTQIQEVSLTKEMAEEPVDKSSDDVATDNIEDESKEDDQQYVNIDTSPGDVTEKESSKENEQCSGPEDYGAEYVNMPVDNDNEENKEVKTEEHAEEADEVPEFDHVIKTETLTSTSQLSRAKVSTTLKRKPPSRGLVRRTAEESGSQENLFEIGADSDYVNMPVNKAVVQQPTPKAEESNKAEPQKKEDHQPTDSDATKNDKNDEKVIVTNFVATFSIPVFFIGS